MVTRVFDILGQYRSKYPMSVALAGKEHGQWKYYSGEDEKFPSALLSVDFSWLEPWARELGIPTEDRNLLIRSEKVEHMVRREISRINQEVGTHERLKRVRLVAEEWTPSNGMLSSSLKLKRAVLRETYRDLMDEIYSVGEEA